MAITDEKGNKLPQPKIGKTELAKNFRERAKQASRKCIDDGIKTSICPDCGFHVRGVNHIDGEHHRKAIKK